MFRDRSQCIGSCGKSAEWEIISANKQEWKSWNESKIIPTRMIIRYRFLDWNIRDLIAGDLSWVSATELIAESCVSYAIWDGNSSLADLTTCCQALFHIWRLCILRWRINVGVLKDQRWLVKKRKKHFSILSPKRWFLHRDQQVQHCFLEIDPAAELKCSRIGRVSCSSESSAMSNWSIVSYTETCLTWWLVGLEIRSVCDLRIWRLEEGCAQYRINAGSARFDTILLAQTRCRCLCVRASHLDSRTSQYVVRPWSDCQGWDVARFAVSCIMPKINWCPWETVSGLRPRTRSVASKWTWTHQSLLESISDSFMIIEEGHLAW